MGANLMRTLSISFAIGQPHAIGKLYILGRADAHPERFDEPGALAHVMRDWHASIGRAILEAWRFPAPAAAASAAAPT